VGSAPTIQFPNPGFLANMHEARKKSIAHIDHGRGQASLSQVSTFLNARHRIEMLFKEVFFIGRSNLPSLSSSQMKSQKQIPQGVCDGKVFPPLSSMMVSGIFLFPAQKRNTDE